MNRLKVDHISVSLGDRNILDDICFRADGGELIGLVGPNGAGKSTLLRTIIGLLTPAQGEIRVEGKLLSGMPRNEAARKVAYLSQGDAIHWPLSVETIVRLGRAPYAGPFSQPSGNDAAAIERAMQRTGIADMADRDVTRLSGGERARVLLARALAVEAPVLMVDEPVGALDPLHGLNIMELLRQEAERGALVIAVLHDLALASRYCSRLIVLTDGKIGADSTPSIVLSPDGMVQHYAVTGHHGTYEQEQFVIPWRPAG